MIKQPTVLVAQPIAEEMVENGQSLTENSGNIVKGLNEVSYPLVPFELESLPITLPEVTASTAEHGQFLDELTTGLANVVNLSFTQISKYLVPLSRKLTDGIECRMDYDLNVTDMLFRNLTINYRKLDLPFFNSNFYPTVAPKLAIDYRAVPLSDLRFPGSFSIVDTDALYEMVNVNNADVKAVIDDHCPGDAFRNYVVDNAWQKIFKSGNGTVDVTDIGDQCPCALFSLFILFTRLKASEEPIDGVTNVSLDEYNTWVSFVLNCLTRALVSIRQNYIVYASTDFTELKNTVKVSDSEFSTIQRPSGVITVGVTDAAIDRFVAIDGETTLSEAILGKALLKTGLAKIPGSATMPSDLLIGKEVFGAVTRDYTDQVKAKLSVRVKDLVKQEVEARLNEFQKDHPEFLAVISRQNESDLIYRRLYLTLVSEVDQFINNLINACVLNTVSVKDYVTGSNLIPQIGRKIGLVVASDILEASSATRNANLTEVGQREALTEAVVKVLTKFIIKN